MTRKATPTSKVKELILGTPIKTTGAILKVLVKKFGPDTDTNRTEAKLADMIKFYATRLHTLGEIPESTKLRHVAPHGRVQGSKNATTIAKEGTTPSKAAPAPKAKAKAVKKVAAKKKAPSKAKGKKVADPAPEVKAKPKAKAKAKVSTKKKVVAKKKSTTKKS